MADIETIEHNKGCCDDCGPLLANAEINGAIRTLQHDNKEMMVIPVIAIVEGVLNGALVPNEELSKFVTAWEGVPIPVYHPEINGQHVSANLPSILEKRVIGRFHNVCAENAKLKGEIWIDVASAKAKGFEAILNTFAAGEMMEVSTAYFADTESTSGTFNGKTYAGIHRNLRPDHLAVLPNAIGACSIADGCGALRANKEDGLMAGVLGKIRGLFAMPSLGLEANETSIDDKIERVRSALQATRTGDDYVYVVDVFNDYVVYEDGGALVRQSYTDTDSAITFGEKSKVRLEKTYIPVANESAEAIETVLADDQPNHGEPTETDEVHTMSEEAQVPQLDAETLTAVNWAKEKYDTEKARLVARLTANKSCQFDEAELNAMHVNALDKLDGSLSPRDFSGRGLPVVNAEVKEEVLTIPAFDGGAK